MQTISKTYLIDALAQKLGKKKVDVKQVVDSFFELMKEELIKGDVIIRFNDFGSFRVVERKARQGLNPQTKEKIEIPARKTIKFKPVKSFTEKLNS